MGCGQSVSIACPHALSRCFGKKGSAHQSHSASPSTRTVNVQSKPTREGNINVDVDEAASAAAAAKVVSSKTSPRQPSSQMQPYHSASGSKSYDASYKSALPTPKNSPDSRNPLSQSDKGDIDQVSVASAPLLGGRPMKTKFARMSFSQSMSSLSLARVQRKRDFSEPEDLQYCEDSVINGDRDLHVLHQQMEMVSDTVKVSQSLNFSLAMELIRTHQPKLKLVAPLPKNSPASPHGIKRSITSSACGESS